MKITKHAHWRDNNNLAMHTYTIILKLTPGVYCLHLNSKIFYEFSVGTESMLKFTIFFKKFFFILFYQMLDFQGTNYLNNF